jgi:hypothetical protein
LTGSGRWTGVATLIETTKFNSVEPNAWPILIIASMN